MYCGRYIAATIFLNVGNAPPTVMVTVIANLNNVALGLTAFHVLWINKQFLPKELQPRWYNQLGISLCGVFYFGLAVLVFVARVIPMLNSTGWTILGIAAAVVAGVLIYFAKAQAAKAAQPIETSS
jgi:hypothetical protein